ncbi:MAG: hypothetical protein ACRD0K_06895 [Egibacteraceae bacterium]
MVSFDPGRQRIRMRPAHLGLLGLLAADPAAANNQPGLDELRAAGIVAGDLPVREAAELLAVVAKLRLLIEIETTLGAGLRRHTVWLTPDLGVSAEAAPDNGEYEYALVVPTMLPFALARIVNLLPLPAPAGARPITVSQELLNRVTATAETDHEAASAELRAAMAGDPQSAALLGRLITERRLSWRMTAAWLEPRGQRHIGSLTVIDAAEAGLWTLTLPTEPDFDDPALEVALAPATAPQVWQRIVALLPSQWSEAAS